MSDRTLRECAILVVEDEYLLAQDICMELADRQAVVVGPAATIGQGLALMLESGQLDGAILDINLRGEHVFGLADELVARGVPFIFATGYDGATVPERFAEVVRCEKPLRMARVIAALGRVVPV